MPKRAIQLYTLRHLDVPFTDLLHHAADTGFEGVEFAFRVGEEDPATIRDTVEETGLSTPSAHVPFQISMSSGLVPVDGMDQDAIIERYKALDVERLVVPGVEAAHFDSVEAIQDVADQLDALATELSTHGFSLLYHNHDFEFIDVDGVSAYERLIEATEHVNFELDVGLSVYAGADPAALLETYGDRIELLHCTDTRLDFDEFAHARFGTGPVDYDSVFEAAEDADVEWYIFENGSQDDPEAELEHARETFLPRTS